jgi:uncharacterized protein (TIGR02246 family)
MRLLLLALLSICVAGCSSLSAPATGRSAAGEAIDFETTIRSLAEELAQAISNRDVTGAARRIRTDHHVVYVSDGTVIRGTEYQQTLAQFYAGLKSLSFKWERAEVHAIGPKVAVFTGWASINSTDAAGIVTDARAIFTLVYVDSGAGWELVAAHKTTLPQATNGPTNA